MQIFRDADPIATAVSSRGSAVTIGAYDGVHLGHQALIREVRRLADERGLAAGLVTFDRHPARVVRPESAPRLLTSLPHRLELLERTGLLDAVWVVTFDEHRRTETAEEFVLEVLVERARAKTVCVGADFHFGYQRKGNVALLQEMGRGLGFDVVALDLVADAAAVYSSTRIRGLLAGGDVAGAATLLGRAHEARGVFVAPAGHELRVAVWPEFCLPAAGEYLGDIDGVEHPVTIAVSGMSTPLGDVLLRVHGVDGPPARFSGEARVRFLQRLE